jgi:hypothetical protein
MLSGAAPLAESDSPSGPFVAALLFYRPGFRSQTNLFNACAGMNPLRLVRL